MAERAGEEFRLHCRKYTCIIKIFIVKEYWTRASIVQNNIQIDTVTVRRNRTNFTLPSKTRPTDALAE
jgi:hypothetical protein